MKDDVKWREIPLLDVDWDITGCTGHVSSTLFNQSCPARDPLFQESHEWAGLTLGSLADMGERQWLRTTGVGVVAVRAIKEIIDRAAAGESVTKQGTGAHSYTPQPWPK